VDDNEEGRLRACREEAMQETPDGREMIDHLKSS
jgi:hypothetical protein